MRSNLAITALVIAIVVACADSAMAPPPPGGTTPPPQLQPNELRPYVIVPSGTPAVGSTIVISFGVMRGSTAPKVGSFAGTIDFDPTVLSFVAESNPSEGVFAVNVISAGKLAAAGVALDGFSSNQLAGASVQVLKAIDLSTLKVVLTELRTVDFEDRKP